MVLARTGRHGPPEIRSYARARRIHRGRCGAASRVPSGDEGDESMTPPRPRWDRCVSHRAQAAEAFVREYFSQTDRQTKLIAGAGFDPRSTRFAELLVAAAGGRVSGLFLREERPSPEAALLSTANKNDDVLRKLVAQSTVERFDIFAVDNAPIGGRQVLKLLSA